MADTNALELELKVALDQFEAGLNKASSDVQAFAKTTATQFEMLEAKTANLSKIWRSMFEASIAAGIVAALYKAADASAQFEAHTKTMQQSLLNHGKTAQVAGSQTQSLTNYLTQLSRTTVGGATSLEQLQNTAQRFVAVTGSTQQAARGVNDALKMSAAYTMDYNEAAHLVQLTMTGHVQLLTRYGILTTEQARGVKTNEQAMQLLEKAIAKMDSSTNTLRGSWGALLNTLVQVVGALGQYVLPVMVGLINTVARVVGAFLGFAKAHPVITQIVAIVGMLLAGMAALGLMLPVLTLAFEFLGVGIGLVTTTIGTLFGGVRLLFSVLGMLSSQLVVAAQWILRLGYYAKGAQLSLFGMGAAAETPIIPLLLLIAAIALVGFALYELNKHWSEVSEYGQKASANIAIAWAEFTNNFLKNGRAVAEVLEGLIKQFQGFETLNFRRVEEGFKEVFHALDATMPTTFTAMTQTFTDTTNVIKSKWAELKAWFASNGIALPKPPPGDATVPGHPGAGAKAGSSNPAMEAMKAFAAQAEAFKAHLAGLKAQMEDLKAAQTELSATIGDGVPTWDQYSQSLEINRKMHANLVAQASTLTAQLKAEQGELKTLDLLRDAARTKKEKDAANSDIIRLKTEITGTQSQQAGINNAIADTNRELQKTIADHAKALMAAGEALDKQRDVLAKAQAAGQTETLRHAAAMTEITQPNLPKAQQELNAAQLKVNTDQIAKNTAQRELESAIRASSDAQLGSDDAAKTRTANELIAAQQNLTHVTDTLEEDEAKRQQLLHEGSAAQQEFNQKLKDAASPFTSWQQLLFSALLQTKSFQEVMTAISNIVKILASVMDAVLLPVLSVLDKILTGVINVFIDLWNMVAAIVHLFGVQVDTLKNITTLFGNLDANIRPLLDVIHDLPTIKEYGKGSYGPLQPDQFAGNQTGTLANQQQIPLLQGILSAVLLFLGIDWLTAGKFLAVMQPMFTSLSQTIGMIFMQGNAMKMGEGVGLVAVGIALLTGHAQGILGFIEKLAGVALIVFGVLLIIQVLHAAHLGVAAAHLAATVLQTALMVAGFSAVVSAVVASMVANVVKFWCPADYQLIETEEHGFIRADRLLAGMHLRDPNPGEWNKIFSVEKLPCELWRIVTELEVVDVNEHHRVMLTDDTWRNVKELRPGHLIKGYSVPAVQVTDSYALGPGRFISINCERHRYVLGKQIGHNDSIDAGRFLSDAATNAFEVTVAGIAAHATDIAGGMAGGAAGGLSSATDNSISINQTMSVGEINNGQSVEDIAAAMAQQATRLARGRRFQIGGPPS